MLTSMRITLWIAGLLTGSGILLFEVLHLDKQGNQAANGWIVALVVVACVVLGWRLGRKRPAGKS